MHGRTIARSGRARSAVLVLALTALALPAAIASSASASAPSADVVVKVPRGAAQPVAGSGIGTRAALDSPDCVTGDVKRYTVYGRVNSSVAGGGPVCTRPFAAGEDNGGATARGVTADAIKVVALVPPKGSMQASSNSNRATGQANAPDEDGFHDMLLPLLQYYETWGRDIEVVYITASGTDETAQRADAVKALAEKPFAVINLDTSGYDVFEADVARRNTLVFGWATSPNEAEALAPYRWGGSDPQAAMINSAEVIGKQLVGKKAEWAGSEELQGETRSFGLVSIDEIFDISLFEETLAEHQGKVTSEATYPANGSTFGDPAVAQAQAPSIVGRMKSAGVTTVVLLADVAMTKAMMEQAVQQDWYPEWFFGGNGFFDYQPFTATYPPEQAAHMFGLNGLAPYVPPATDAESGTLGAIGNSQDWFWGRSVGTSSARHAAAIGWLMNGIHAAGPNLTPKTFQQGLFSLPATGGSASNTPLGGMTGYGNTTGLPYTGYFSATLDFAPSWVDPASEGVTPAIGRPNKPASWWVDGGRRYSSGNWPSKKLAFFDKEKSITSFTEWPASVPVPQRVPCEACPSTGGSTLTPGSPSPNGFVAAAPEPSSS